MDMRQFNRAPSHHKPPLPGASDLAAMIREGETVEDLAATFERRLLTIRTRLSIAGYSSVTGESVARAEAADRPQLGIVALVRADQPWAVRSRCGETDPEAFFPEKGGSSREAKAVCKTCPVQAECLDYAIDNDERFGIWGGLSERERRALKAQLRPGDEPTEPDLEGATTTTTNYAQQEPA